MHPPLSAGRAKNTIMTECTQECAIYNLLYIVRGSTVVLPLTLLRVHISLEPGYWRPAVPMTFLFQPISLNTSPPSYRHTGIHLSFNISPDINNPPVSVLASTAGRLIALALSLSVFESFVRKSGLLGPPMNRHENHVLSKFIEQYRTL